VELDAFSLGAALIELDDAFFIGCCSDCGGVIVVV